MQRPRYPYEPLPSHFDHFRLIELQAGKGASQLHCRLHTVPLSQAASYEAISYVWGDPSVKVDVACDDGLVAVTTNLKNALTLLRHPHQNRSLWADAISINQEDLDERSRQVRIMREIFSRARTVLAWLGPEHDEDKDAIPLIRLLDRTAEEVLGTSPDKRRDNALSINRLSDDTYLEGFPALGEGCWQSLRRLFDRPYFSRAWVIREVNNMKSVQVLYGTDQLDFETIACAARIFFDIITYRPGPTAGLESNGLQNVTRLLLYDLNKLSLQDTLRFARRFCATDPRDKIYAVFNWERSNPDNTQLVPDYSKTVAEVYEKLAHLIISQTGDLTILQHVHHDDAPDPSIPTWVPQWNLHKWSSIIGLYNPRLRACGSRSHIITPPKHGCLSVRGLRVGAVAELDRPRTWDELGITDTISDEHARLFETYLHLCVTAASEEEKRREVTSLTMTLVAGFNFADLTDAALDSERHGNDAAAFMLRILQLSPAHSQLRAQANQHPDFLQQLTKEASRGSWKDYEAGFKNVHDRRVLFKTRGGEYGLGPEATRAHDQIWILFGSRAPILLRPRDERFEVVGECYVDHLMEGQAIAQMEEGLLLVDDIELC